MKNHFKVLDGLRGLAALSVVIFHAKITLMPHAYIAVDFFFMLSGFVIGYAYDDRLQTMGKFNFIKIRLIRLHPMAILGTVIGILCFFLDPFIHYPDFLPPITLITILITSLLMLPSQSPYGSHIALFPFNPPTWSLFSEYLINLVYILFASKITKKALFILILISGIVTFITTINRGTILYGVTFDTFFLIPIRTTFPFFMGLFIYRANYIIRLKVAFPILCLILIAIFIVPSFQYPLINGTVDSLIVLFLFPLIISISAGSFVSGYVEQLCNFLGKISYPLYIIHFPILLVYQHWTSLGGYSKLIHDIVFGMVYFFLVLLSWLLLKLYDEPLRKKLTKIAIDKSRFQS